SEQFRHGDWVTYAQFSPDGKRIVTSSKDNKARIWDIAPSQGRCPDWLPRLAEAISGEVVSKQGVLEPTMLNRAEVVNETRRKLNKEPGRDDWAVWGRWFLAEPFNRTI